MNEKHDIENFDDIKLLVDNFYAKVRADDLLAPIFNERIKDTWPEHLQKLYAFWQTILLNEHTYFGMPFPPHKTLPVEHKHFQQWLALFAKTLHELFVGKKADEALMRANKIAEMFEAKIEHYKSQKIKI